MVPNMPPLHKNCVHWNVKLGQTLLTKVAFHKQKKTIFLNPKILPPLLCCALCPESFCPTKVRLGQTLATKVVWYGPRIKMVPNMPPPLHKNCVHWNVKLGQTLLTNVALHKQKKTIFLNPKILPPLLCCNQGEVGPNIATKVVWYGPRIKMVPNMPPPFIKIECIGR